MITTAPVRTKPAPLPEPILAYAAYADDLGFTILVAPGVSGADAVTMTQSMISEMCRTGRGRAWRVSVQ